uniref:Uncharacterized protein n=1 Tax=Zea mays TaxID=4577 RepID=B6TC84_MAIZE|nr:hypothetical protein [Zea mays]
MSWRSLDFVQKSLSSSRCTGSCSICMHSSSNHSGVSVASAFIIYILLLVALYYRRFGLVQTRHGFVHY